MFRIARLGFSVVLLLICASACEKSAEPSERADQARLDGLMPGATPRFDPTYVVNQADVKVLPERTISYEPLDVFRAKNAEARAAKATKPKAESTAAAAKASKSGDKPSGTGMIGRLKARLFGGLIGDEAGAAPDDDAAADMDDSEASDSEDKADDDAAPEDDDEASDEEEADDDASDDDETDADDESSDDNDESEDEDEDDDSTDEDDDE